MASRSLKFDFQNQNGDTLSGRLELPLYKPKALALFAHCFTCSKSLLAATRIPRKLTEMGIGVLRFDFTGLGNSEGDFSNTNFSSNVEDLVAAYNHLKKEYFAPEILIGHSLGGAAVLKAATVLDEAKAVVTIGAPSDIRHILHAFHSAVEQIQATGSAEVNLAGRKFKIKKQFIDDLKQASILDGVARMNKALLIMHSPIDNTVSIDHAAEIFVAARHPKSFVTLDNSDHLITKSKDAQYAANVIGAWVDRYLPEHIDAREPVSPGVVRVKSNEFGKFLHDIYTSENSLVADEPKSFGGNGFGPSPYELLLSALGACTSMTMKMYAERKKWPLQSIQVDLKHEKIHASDCQSCETKDGKLDRILKSISIKGPLTDEQKSRLLEIAEMCPVNKTLHSEISIQTLPVVNKP